MKSKILIKPLLFIAGFIFQEPMHSQDMFVKANTYVYVSNVPVYVKNDLELNAATSNMYLRKDGQLLQGTTGIGANKGLGAVSVFQEGSVNNFQYNYWCSPVGNVTTATSVNNPFGIGQLGVPTSVTNSTPAIILPNNYYDGTASPFQIAPYWIFKFSVKNSYADWVQVGGTTTINPGEGFLMKGSSGTNITTVDGVQNNPDGSHQRYDFRGKPNDGTINIPVMANQLTLTGNPYPSAINLQTFLQQETNCTGTAYFWEHDKTANSHYVAEYKGGYGTYTSADIYIPAVFYTYDGAGNQVTNIGSSTNNFERKFSPIGQGFFIEGSTSVVGVGNVQMKNTYRAFVKEGFANKSQFERKSNTKKEESATNANAIPQIRFNTLLNNGPVSQMVLAFDSASSEGEDRALDGASINNGSANNYFTIDNKEYVINVLPFDMDKKVSIGFRNTVETNYKITVNQMLNIPEVTNVYLHDKTTDLYHDIKNSFYDLSLPAGTNNTQFEITFRNDTTTLGVDDNEKQNFFVQQNNDNKTLIINNPAQLELLGCSVYDVVGKLIFSKDKLGTDTSFSFPTSSLTDGVYIVKLTTNDKEEMGTKIIVKN